MKSQVYSIPAKERLKKGEAHKPIYMSTNQNHTYEHAEHKTLRCPALRTGGSTCGNIFREPGKTGSHPGLNWGPLTLAVSALPPELWPPGDSQPSQFSISLCMCRQNPTRDRPVTPLHQGRSHTEYMYMYSTEIEVPCYQGRDAFALV